MADTSIRVLCSITDLCKAIGAAQDAARMDRVVNFYAKLPRGAAPEAKPTGLLERYQARYFTGKNASGARKYSPCCRGRTLDGLVANDTLNSHRPGNRRYPSPELRHGVLLPPSYVLPFALVTEDVQLTEYQATTRITLTKRFPLLASEE